MTNRPTQQALLKNQQSFQEMIPPFSLLRWQFRIWRWENFDKYINLEDQTISLDDKALCYEVLYPQWYRMVYDTQDKTMIN